MIIAVDIGRHDACGIGTGDDPRRERDAGSSIVGGDAEGGRRALSRLGGAARRDVGCSGEQRKVHIAVVVEIALVNGMDVAR